MMLYRAAFRRDGMPRTMTFAAADEPSARRYLIALGICTALLLPIRKLTHQLVLTAQDRPGC